LEKNKKFWRDENASMQEMFSNDPARASKFNLKWNDFLIDYSKYNMSGNSSYWASKRNGAKAAIQDYFNGGIINQTEDRAVLHTAPQTQ
jgi:glucose-6-phosphate isomerase